MTFQKETEELPFVDTFDEDETEKNFLLSKPVCFAVFGKPGVGKTTLAQQITQAWKCIRVEALSVLEEQLMSDSESGVMVQSMLVSGQSIPDELVMKLMLMKLNSPEVSHFGYIITEIPSLSQDSMTTLQQLELIKNLNLKPDVIINIKCPDYDLCQRISGQRQHSSTGHVYTKEQWDPEVIESRRKKKKEAHKEGKLEEEGEEEEEQEEEEAFLAEMQMVAEIIHHLVQRPEDHLENVESLVKLYKETILHSLEQVMAEHDPQYLIELDGNKSPEELFMIVIERLKYLNLKTAAVLIKLQSSEEETNDIMETDELLRTVASYKLIAPRYRWQRSRWGRTCPVNLKKGHIYAGSPDFAVSFLGKMYCLSSEETLKTFLLNPRPYLLPPMPVPPCKIFVCGPHNSGKTTLSNLLAEHYKGKVIDYATHVQPRFDKARETLIKNTIDKATEAAIQAVKEKLLTELQARKQAALAALEARELQRQYEKKEPAVLPEETIKNRDTMPFLSEDSQRPISPADSAETKSKSESTLSDQAAEVDKADEERAGEVSTLGWSSEGPSQDLGLSDKALEVSIDEVTANHPEVLSMIEVTVKASKDMNFEHPYVKHAEILEEVLTEVTTENRNRFSGAPEQGGWILDNCPLIKELWALIFEKGIMPDLIICLSDTENDGKYLLNRLYLKNKSEIDAKILERLSDEQKKKKEEE
uniref:Uncharacterized protein n=1 Tax=Otolemur garnettii TaxID=30611 RepID=H0WY93_OTOGA